MCVCVCVPRGSERNICGERDVRRWEEPGGAGDVVQGIVNQLSEVSQHTTSATTAMRHLVAEITNLQEMRAMDTTTVFEVLAAAGMRSGSPGAVDNGFGMADPALMKLQEKDPEFPKYDGIPEHFLPRFVAVEEKELRQVSDQAAIIFVT